jgi:hypothetical protein
MEREHLIIIALILVALYMMNTDHKDTVKTMAPMGRIRYEGDSALDPNRPLGHIRTREGYEAVNDGMQPNHILLSDKSFAHSQHIRNHIRNRNMNSMFNGMMGTREGFDADNSNQDNIGNIGMSQDIRGLYV